MVTESHATPVSQGRHHAVAGVRAPGQQQQQRVVNEHSLLLSLGQPPLQGRRQLQLWALQTKHIQNLVSWKNTHAEGWPHTIRHAPPSTEGCTCLTPQIARGSHERGGLTAKWIVGIA